MSTVSCAAVETLHVNAGDDDAEDEDESDVTPCKRNIMMEEKPRNNAVECGI